MKELSGESKKNLADCKSLVKTLLLALLNAMKAEAKKERPSLKSHIWSNIVEVSFIIEEYILKHGKGNRDGDGWYEGYEPHLRMNSNGEWEDEDLLKSLFSIFSLLWPDSIFGNEVGPTEEVILNQI